MLYPSNNTRLPPGPPRDLFGWFSVPPEYMFAPLRAAQVPVSTGARGMIYNASVADLIRMLSLVKAYAQALAADRPPHPPTPIRCIRRARPKVPA